MRSVTSCIHAIRYSCVRIYCLFTGACFFLSPLIREVAISYEKLFSSLHAARRSAITVCVWTVLAGLWVVSWLPVNGQPTANAFSCSDRSHLAQSEPAYLCIIYYHII